MSRDEQISVYEYNQDIARIDDRLDTTEEYLAKLIAKQKKLQKEVRECALEEDFQSLCDMFDALKKKVELMDNQPRCAGCLTREVFDYEMYEYLKREDAAAQYVPLSKYEEDMARILSDLKSG